MLPDIRSKAIAWRTMKSEPTSFVDPELYPHHTDLLFSVRMSGAPAYIYFLLEHQSTTDPEMPFRVLGYSMRIWDRHREQHRKRRRRPLRRPLPVIITIVISNVPGGWEGPLSFHDLFQPDPTSMGLADLVPHFSLLLIDLSTATNDELESWALEAFPKAALFALRDARDPHKLLQDFDHWGALLAEAAQAPSGMDAVRQLMRYIALASPDLNIEDFRDKIRQYLPKAETELMTIYEQALHKGREEGRQQTSVNVLAKQLTLKFGELPHEYQARLRAATPEDVDRYLERILTADTIAAVFADPA